MVAGHRQQATEVGAISRSQRVAKLRESLLALLLVVAFIANAAAGPFSQLVIFGDSLSDVGNVSQATAGLPFVPRTPGPYYYNGRFSNGPVYAEALASGLDLPPLVHSRSGGDNFAHGGAKTSGTSFPNSLVVRDVDDQVGDFLGSRTADPNALFVVWAGANDLIGGQTNISIPINRLATDIGRLITAGARSFLVPNLPLLGYTPRYNGNPTNFATYNARSEQFNAALATMLDDVAANHPTITTFRFDIATLFSQAIANPAAFGFTNVTHAAAPGLQPGASSYDTSQIAANPHEYLFWDDLHPTTAGHAMLAQHALQLFALWGDFNGDDIIDAADYVAWRKNGGTPEEYGTWRAHFGATAGSGSLSNTTVPEPASILLLIWAAAIGTRRGRRIAS
jgi:phospholipase/lecithinase/hemolysin